MSRISNKHPIDKKVKFGIILYFIKFRTDSYDEEFCRDVKWLNENFS